MSSEVLTAIISAVSIVAVAIVNGFTLYLLGRQASATDHIRDNVAKLEVNTNSMSTRLEALATKAGVVIGRDQVTAENARKDSR